MMDEKKVREAIAWIKNERTIHEYGIHISPSIPKEQISMIGEYYNLAIEALEKQLPKKPRISKAYYGCPDCTTIRSLRQKHNYCHDCGQRLDWSE